MLQILTLDSLIYANIFPFCYLLTFKMAPFVEKLFHSSFFTLTFCFGIFKKAYSAQVYTKINLHFLLVI